MQLDIYVAMLLHKIKKIHSDSYIQQNMLARSLFLMITTHEIASCHILSYKLQNYKKRAETKYPTLFLHNIKC